MGVHHHLLTTHEWADSQQVGRPALQVSDSYPLAVGLRLVQAPAAFARPMVQRKLFRPCFRVSSALTHVPSTAMPRRAASSRWGITSSSARRTSDMES